MSHDKYALTIGAFLLIGFAGVGCALFNSARAVTPEQRAKVYKAHAGTIDTLCAAYTFDRATGLVSEVPEMTRACQP